MLRFEKAQGGSKQSYEGARCAKDNRFTWGQIDAPSSGNTFLFRLSLGLEAEQYLARFFLKICGHALCVCFDFSRPFFSHDENSQHL